MRKAPVTPPSRRPRALTIAIFDSGQSNATIAMRAGIELTRFSRIMTGAYAPYPHEMVALGRVLSQRPAKLFPKHWEWPQPRKVMIRRWHKRPADLPPDAETSA